MTGRMILIGPAAGNRKAYRPDRLEEATGSPKQAAAPAETPSRRLSSFEHDWEALAAEFDFGERKHVFRVVLVRGAPPACSRHVAALGGDRGTGQPRLCLFPAKLPPAPRPRPRDRFRAPPGSGDGIGA